MPTATATESEPTHDLTLYDGTTTYGFVLCDANGFPNPFAIDRSPTNRTSIKMSQGRTKYEDLRGPHLSLVQDDWSGGRGLEDFGEDGSRFFDSYRMNTWMPGRVILGPQVNYSAMSGTSYREGNQNMPGSMKWQALFSTARYLAYKFTTISAYDADKAYLWIRKIGTPTGVLTVELCADGTGGDVGDPGAVLKTVTLAVASVTDTPSIFHVFDWATTQSLTDATAYHLKIYGNVGDTATNCWEVGGNNASGNTQYSAEGSSWAAAGSIDIYFRVVDAEATKRTKFYEYKGQLYMARYAKLYYNGDRGAADSNNGALTTLVDATKSWTTNEWAGCTASIVAGPGSFDQWNYRTIVSNNATTLTVSGAWETEHTTATEYVILGSDKWTEQTGHGLSVEVTDVLVSGESIYYAQGDSVNMRRHREYNNSGTWSGPNAEWSVDGINKATFLKIVEDPVDGSQIWKANDDSSDEVAISRAPAGAWNTDLVFGTDIVVGDKYERLTGLETYGDPLTLWVLKEGSIWEIANDIPSEKPLREMKSVASSHNGRAHLVQGVYLYFSLLFSLQRFYRNNIDDVGPWVGTGLPDNRQGAIHDMQGYPPFFWAAVRAEGNRYSSILVSAGHSDWHEFYRAPETAQRIMSLHLQIIPGEMPDRLWVQQGPDVIYFLIPSNTLDPYRDSSCRFTHEGHIISSWHYAGLQDVSKFWNSLKVFSEALSGTSVIIEAEYQTDDSIETDAWTALNGTFNTVPMEEVDFSSANDVTGRRLRYRLRFITNDSSKTPKMKATLIEALGRVAPKWEYKFTFRAKDENLDREGDDDSYTAVETLITKVDEWAAAATPLTMRSLYSPFDNKTVFAEAAPMRPYLVTPDEQSESHVSQMTVYEK